MNNDINNTNSFEDEVFTPEELNALNEKLKNTENIKIPESLSQEKMLEKLSNINSFKPESPEKIKKNRKKMIYSAVATAASFAIVLSSLFIIKPWKKPVSHHEVKNNDQDVEVQDYSQIEELFAGYAESYGVMLRRKPSTFFGLIKEEAAADSAATGNMAGSVNSYNNTSSAPGAVKDGKTSPMTTDDLDLKHGETNEQVKGVSEADIIKNDGKYIYIANSLEADWDAYYDALYSDKKAKPEETTVIFYEELEEGETEPRKETETTSKTEKKPAPKLQYSCKISIIEPQNDGKLKKLSNIEIIPDSKLDIFYMQIQEIYVSGNKLIALVRCNLNKGDSTFKYAYNGSSADVAYPTYGSSDSVTMAICYDIKNKDDIKELWRVYQDGSYSSSRLVGDRLVTISNHYVDITTSKEEVIENCVPRCDTTADCMKRINANDICIMNKINDTCYVVVSSVNINDKNTLKSEAVLGGGEEVYCTNETLYTTSVKYESYAYNGMVEEIFGEPSQTTQIYKFDISDGDIKFLCKGEVPGCMLNQFSMDEYDGYLRVAVTTDAVAGTISNGVYVLDGELNTKGKIEDIAKGETIKSVRFTGDTGYVVTFEQTDPLFVLDLKNPEKPEILGELKIPGFSTYLHPVGNGLLLAVGVDGDENGQGEGIKISLFDVSDPKKPVEADKITLSGYREQRAWCYYSSDAFYSHKALCYDSEENIMYVPYGRNSAVINENTYRTEESNSLGVIAVKIDSQNKKLRTEGEYKRNAATEESTFAFSRVTYIDNIIYALPDSRSFLTSFDKTTQIAVDEADINNN